MNIDDEDIWRNLKYRMREEGFHYCFDKYSSWSEVEDEEFHKLRLNYLKYAKLLEEYVNKKNENYDNEW